MKAVVLLLALAVVSCHGLGYPNFNLPCVQYPNSGRFALASTNQIPYCIFSNMFGQFELNPLLAQGTPGYKLFFEATDDNLLVVPVVANQNVQAFTSADVMVVDLGPTVPANITSLISSGNVIQVTGTSCFSRTVGSSYPARLPGGTLMNGLGFTNLVSCPFEAIVGKYETEGRDVQSPEGAAQTLALQRPFTFYGLVGSASTF